MLSLIVKFWIARRDAVPSRAFRLRLRQTLSAALPVETRQEHQRFALRRTAVGLAILLPVLFFGTSMYAYASPSVTEGNMFYPMKRGIESLQLRMMRDTENVTAYRLKLYGRRLDEAERLFESRDAMIQTLNAAVEENETLELRGDFEKVHPEMHERLRKNQERYEKVRMRVYMNEPIGDSPLRTPSFMTRKMQN